MKTYVMEEMPTVFWQKIKKNDWQKYFIENPKLAEIAIIRTKTQFDKKLFKEFPNLKLIIRAGTGIDNINTREANKRNILVCNTPDANVLSAYEHTVSFIFALIKQHQKWKTNILGNNWKNGVKHNWEISDLKILVVGVGRVGSQVAKAMKYLGAEVRGVDPYLSNKDWNEKGITNVNYHKGLSWCNLLTFHCPLTQETRDYFSVATLESLDKPIWLINTARGKVVNEQVIEQGINVGQILGFATDVFSEEPWTYKEFAAKDNVFVSPHVGAFTKKAKGRMALEVLQAWEDYNFHKILSDKIVS